MQHYAFKDTAAHQAYPQKESYTGQLMCVVVRNCYATGTMSSFFRQVIEALQFHT